MNETDDFPSDGLRRRVLSILGMWLILVTPYITLYGNPENSLHVMFLQTNMDLLFWLAIGVVLDSGLETVASRIRR